MLSASFAMLGCCWTRPHHPFALSAAKGLMHVGPFVGLWANGFVWFDSCHTRRCAQSERAKKNILRNRISRPRALHHHGVAAVPAKAILRISARLRPTGAACFCLHARVRENCGWNAFSNAPARWGFRLRTCTSRTSRTSSARSLSGLLRRPHLSSGEEGGRKLPSAELGISHSHVLLIDMRDARLRDTVFLVSS